MTVGQIYGSGTGITSDIVEAPSVPMDSDERTFWGEVEKFKAKADEAYTLWQKLRAKRQAAQANARLHAEYTDVMEEAEDITGKVSDVERLAAQVREQMAGSVLSVFGLEGYNAIKRVAKNNAGGLGFIQFAAIALVSGAIAWLGTWITKAVIVDRKLTAVESMVSQGVDPAEAGEIIAERGDPGALQIFAGQAGTGVALAALVGVALFFLMPRGR